MNKNTNKLLNNNLNNDMSRDFSKARQNADLNPNYITGFSDAEGNFAIVTSTIEKNNKVYNKVYLRFSVTQKAHSAGILYELMEYFGCGQVIRSSKGCMRYVVQNRDDINNIIIPHFDSFPLQTSKRLNFLTFKEGAKFVTEGQHLTPEGFNKLNELKGQMNENRTFDELYVHLALRDIVLNPYWILAFVDAEGCFGTLLSLSKAGKIITRNRLSIPQSSHDYKILLAIKQFFGAGYLSPKEDKLNTLDKAKASQDETYYYNSVTDNVISFFDSYHLLTRKFLDYLDFKQFYLLKKEKQHLTPAGFKKMANIFMNMNSGRNKQKITKLNINKILTKLNKNFTKKNKQK